MPNTQYVTRESAVIQANAQKTALAASFLRLTKEGLVIDSLTTRADLLANECDFDDYPPAGIPLALWTGPSTPSSGGAVITSPVASLVLAAVQVVPNTVGGWWVDLAAAAGVYVAGNFDPPIPMQEAGNAIEKVIQSVIGKN